MNESVVRQCAHHSITYLHSWLSIWLSVCIAIGGHRSLSRNTRAGLWTEHIARPRQLASIPDPDIRFLSSPASVSTPRCFDTWVRNSANLRWSFQQSHLQTVSSVTPHQPLSHTLPSISVSRRSIGQVWQNFNDVADGFGISKDEMQEICVSLKDELNISRLAMLEKAASFFQTLDTDRVILISLESLYFSYVCFVRTV
jgi:hypothetical protein